MGGEIAIVKLVRQPRAERVDLKATAGQDKYELSAELGRFEASQISTRQPRTV
jgi:hypothetical protein